MDRGAWRATVHGVTKSSDTTEVTQEQQEIIYLEIWFTDGVSSATKEEEICPKGKKGAACL